MGERADMTPAEIEEGARLALDFGKLQRAAACGEGLVPVAVQDADSGEVLIVAYANEEALNYARREGVAAFWSTSRNALWVKGATSGDLLQIVEIRVNCEQNSLLYRVRPKGAGACHTRDAGGRARAGCYYRRLVGERLEPGWVGLHNSQPED